MTDRTFGIEIEAQMPHGMTMGALAILLRRTGQTVKCAGYTHETTSYWKLVSDGSVLGNAVECVSPILSGEAGLLAAHKIAEAMKAAGCTVDKSTGLHVHVGASDLSLTQMRALAINFVHSETAFDAIMPPSRRKDENTFIRSNRTGFGGSYENEGINKAIAAFNNATTMDRLIAMVSAVSADGQNITSWRAIGGGRNSGTRYRKLNLLPYLRHKTVEFRQHGGTVDGPKVTNWIKLCVAMVERSLTARPRPRTSVTAHNATTELGMLLYWLRLDRETCKYFRQRRKEFSERNLANTLTAEQIAQAEATRLATIAATERARVTEQRRVATAARNARRAEQERLDMIERMRLAREAIENSRAADAMMPMRATGRVN